MAEILEIPDFITKHDINAKDMLKEIAKSKPDHAFVICWPEDGSPPTYHCTTSDMPVVLFNLNKFIHRMYREAMEHEDEHNQ